MTLGCTHGEGGWHCNPACPQPLTPAAEATTAASRMQGKGLEQTTRWHSCSEPAVLVVGSA